MTTSRPEFRFFSHFEYGLLREPARQAVFDRFMQDGTWQRIILNPFTASMAPITEAAASSQAGGRDLYAPITAQERPGGRVVPVPQ